MAYSSEVGNVNVEILKEKLNVDRKGAEVVFQNEDLFIISPSIQNGSNWFDLRITNLERYYYSGKKGLLLLRHNKHFLIADLNDFSVQLMKKEDMRTTSTGGEHWKFNILVMQDFYTVYNHNNRNLLYNMKYSEAGSLKKEVEKLLRSIKPFKSFSEDDGNNCIKKYDLIDIDNSRMINHINVFLKSKGFYYYEDNIKNLYLTLRTKPFVIISGISGTGKTKIVQLFAEAIGATEENNQFKLIPVRPDWSDSSELLGYTDIKGDFVKGPLTEMLEHAHQNPKKPHFVLLDEMNLARVEYYFSDVLSVMESRKRVDGQITSSTLITVEEESLTIPGNLYIIGTVNMDETTHPFSKKVLDRANTIEFNEIKLMNFGSITNSETVEPVPVSNEVLESSFIHLIDAFASHEKLIRDVSEKLEKINEYLIPIHAQVGYRVRDEICFYMAHNEEGGQLLSPDDAMDFCIMQKILPRIGGMEAVVRPVLNNLKEELSSYPRCTKKIEEMLGRLDVDGFTSFWIS
ncbi:hypothetical protein D1B33_12520 [Lysinibacillus yapensis]|uniref:ATPase dynein-related AAA domain-containing protein n=1 Tax=Ureibacillus yapensis TaxID=2304605 RepID=A0A396S6G4_9BACL|nr:AAA family ATPase [Lysinibacillus yapensis]RHW35911.1 hypothetical protein D1B33_12520 [Lysinibacillus yapensis]